MPVITTTGDQFWDLYGVTDVDLYPGDDFEANSAGTQDFWEDGLCEGFLFYEAEEPTLEFTEVLLEGEGVICFEMDAVQTANEVLDNIINQLDHLRRADFWKLQNLAVRTDTFGTPLTKYRLSGGMEWGKRLAYRYNDAFDLATRYFRTAEHRRIWALFDISQLYEPLNHSLAEVAIDYTGQYQFDLVFVWTNQYGKRYYQIKDVSEAEHFNFYATTFEHEGEYYYPEQVFIRTQPAIAALQDNSDIWGSYRTLHYKLDERIGNEFQLNTYHDHTGIIVRLPRYRDISYGPKDLQSYNAWLVENSLPEVLTTTEISTSADAYIYASQPNTNYGSRTYLLVGFEGSSSSHVRSLIYFDISSIPTYHQITKATLRLLCNATKNISIEARVWAVQEYWEESEVTWNSRISGVSWITAGGTYSKMYGRYNLTPSDLNQYVDIDITDLVRDWVYGNIINYGLIITAFYNRGTVYPNHFNFESREATGGDQPLLIVEHGDFPKVDDTQPVSANNPYIRDDENLWNWRTAVISEWLSGLVGEKEIIPITNSDYFSEVDTNIAGYGATVWNGVSMAYTRTNSEGYIRTVGVPDSTEKFSGQWGLNFTALPETIHYVGTSIDAVDSRYQIGRTQDYIDSLENNTGYSGMPRILIDVGIYGDGLEDTKSLRPRDIEEVIRYARKNNYRWIVHGWDRIRVSQEELEYWCSVSQAVNDLGNTWDLTEWTPPEAFNIQIPTETEQSISLNLQQSILPRRRYQVRDMQYATVQMTWQPLGLKEMGLLQKAYQFGQLLQWNIENKFDVDSCQWETAFRLNVNGEIRYYGAHRSWLAGSVRVKIDDSEVYHNDSTYGWSVNYEEGYIVFDNDPPAPSAVVTLYYQCRMSLLIQSIVPADTPELYKGTRFLPVEVIFKEVR